MESNVNYTLVGAFIIGLTIAMIVIALWLSVGLTGKQYNFYLAYMNESVSGLSANAPVKYNGVDIGMVREISLNPKNLNQVRLLLAIESSIPIKTDTLAELMSQGITGLSFIDLSGGSNGAPLLTIKDDERYPVIKTQHSLYFRLDNAARDITDAIKTASTDLHVIMGKENQIALQRTLANLDRITTTVASHSKQLDTLLKNSAEASQQFPAAIKQIQNSATAFQVLSSQSLPQFSHTLNNLQSLTSHMNQLTNELEQNPSILIRGRAPLPAGPGE